MMPHGPSRAPPEASKDATKPWQDTARSQQGRHEALAGRPPDATKDGAKAKQDHAQGHKGRNKPNPSSATQAARKKRVMQKTKEEPQWIAAHTGDSQQFYKSLNYENHLQSIYHDRAIRNIMPVAAWLKLQFVTYAYSNLFAHGEQHYHASMDSELEAFTRNPTVCSFAAWTNQLAAFTNWLNEVFLSYGLRQQ